MPIPLADWFRFREARPAPARVNVAKMLVQSAAMWTTGLFVVPLLCAHMERRLGLGVWQFGSPRLRAVAVAVWIVCGTCGLSTGVVMAVRGEGTPLPTDTARRLVLSGFYRYVRNPMAIFGLAQMLCSGLYVGSPTMLLATLICGLVWNYAVRPAEEADLSRRFGPPYDAYRRAVRCWIPRLAPYLPAPMENAPR